LKEAEETILREPAPLPFFARRSSYPWLVVGTVCIGGFIGQVDASIVQLALPELERAFDAQLDAVTWVAVGYVLGFAAALPIYGRLAEIGGRKLLYLCGFALFAIWSALCGLAPDLDWLVAFRVLQGVSGALLGANSLVILVAAVGPAHRGKAIGTMAAAQAVGLCIGPALGGVLLDALSWRWVFWVTVPFALLGALLGWLIVPPTADVSPDSRFDLPGAVLLVPALAALMLAISELHAWGPFSLAILACVAAAALLLGGFVWRERRAPAPLIDLRIFRSPAFSAGSVGVLVSYAMLYGMFFAMSFALVRGYHDSAFAAGLRLTIVPIALGVIAPLGGALSDKHPRAVMLGGMALCALSAFALSQLLDGTPASLTPVMGALAVYGIGLGCYIAPNNSATMGAAPAGKSGVAGGFVNLLRAFGVGIGVAAASSVLGWRLELAVGLHRNTTTAPEAALLAATEAVLLMLAAFAALYAAAALIRGQAEIERKEAVKAHA
jgi:EmrB/QacA subfamily drug resistance transporter